MSACACLLPSPPAAALAVIASKIILISRLHPRVPDQPAQRAGSIISGYKAGKLAKLGDLSGMKAIAEDSRRRYDMIKEKLIIAAIPTPAGVRFK